VPLWLIAGMVCFGSATPVARIVGDEVPVGLATCLRMAIAVLVLALALTLAGRRRLGELRSDVSGFERSDVIRLLVLGLVGTVAFTVLMLAGMQRAPGSVAAVVMAATPAVTAIGATIFLRESMPHRTLLAVALAVAGITLVNLGTRTSGGDAIVVGSVLVFGAVCSEATYTLVAKRLASDIDAVSLTFLAAAIATVATLPWALFDGLGFDWYRPSLGDWVAVVWWGAGTMALGSWLWFRGLQRSSGANAAPYMGVMPVSALLLSYVLLEEPFEWIHVAGMAIVLLGLAAQTLPQATGEPLRATADRIRGGYLFVPLVFFASAVLAAIGSIAIDRQVENLDTPLWTYTGGPQNATDVLTTIASSMITFTGVVFSIMIVALQLTSSQFSPRALRNFLRDGTTQVALGMFVATFTYSFAALAAVRVAAEDDETFVPVITVTTALALLGSSIIVFIHFIHHTANSMRAVTIIERIAQETRRAVEAQYPPAVIETVPPMTSPRPSMVVSAPSAGVIADVDLRGLAHIASRRRATVEVCDRAGVYVPRGAPLLLVYDDDSGEQAEWSDRVRLEHEPTMHFNAEFGFRQLVDIAERALSPGINDPTTAVQCLDRLHDLLRMIANRPMPERRFALVEGVARASIPQPGFDRLLALALDEISHWGDNSIQVRRRIDAIIDDLLTVTVGESRRAALSARRPRGGSDNDHQRSRSAPSADDVSVAAQHG
jgi:uncharacterized membrane protein